MPVTVAVTGVAGDGRAGVTDGQLQVHCQWQRVRVEHPRAGLGRDRASLSAALAGLPVNDSEPASESESESESVSPDSESESLAAANRTVSLPLEVTLGVPLALPALA